MEEVNDNFGNLSQKVSENEEEHLSFSKKMEKMISSFKYLQNDDFHHFVQILIDKEIGHKLPEFQNQYKNPFDVLSDQ